jgi:hypothetical protein
MVDHVRFGILGTDKFHGLFSVKHRKLLWVWLSSLIYNKSRRVKSMFLQAAWNLLKRVRRKRRMSEIRRRKLKLSVNPLHLPISFDPENTMNGESGGLGGFLTRLGGTGGGTQGASTAAELALGNQFLAMLQGEMNGGGTSALGTAGVSYADLMDKSVMTRFIQAVQDMALEGAGGAAAARQATGAGEAAQAADGAVKMNAPDGVGRPIQAEAVAGAVSGGHAEPGAGAARAFGKAEGYGAKAVKSMAGFLAARFESGSNPGAIGFDRVGGTSYGTFQIASRPGTMDRFIEFLKTEAPELASRLKAAGPANTGSAQGDMPDVWKSIAEEDPDGFFALQHDFIKESHLKPAARWIAEQTGIDVLGRNQALSEVLFSTSVQHGARGSAAIFARAVEKAMGESGVNFDKALIKEVYKDRAEQFGSSTADVREAVKSRLSREEGLALSLLGAEPLLDASV